MHSNIGNWEIWNEIRRHNSPRRIPSPRGRSGPSSIARKSRRRKIKMISKNIKTLKEKSYLQTPPIPPIPHLTTGQIPLSATMTHPLNPLPSNQ